jgi:sugar transferase (PEP-CTERM/EpsH1 system associated)
LAHRIPYPPNKGDKIRSFHLLKHLSERFRVYLGTFVDDPNDWQYCAAVRAYCADVCFIERKPRWHKALAATALLQGGSISVRFYASGVMQRWVDSRVALHGIERALVFCAPMAQFVAPQTSAGKALKKIVVDFVDADSEKWRQYATNHDSVLLRAVYRQEAANLLAYERYVADFSSSSFFVSPAEAALFSSRAPECAAKTGHFLNGVDTHYFKPDPGLPSPYHQRAQVLVFTGAMDYWPNVDAVVWFADKVFPTLLEQRPDLQFWIVGGKPAPEVAALAQCPGIFVTGRVPDVRPYLQHALAAVAPLRIARGIQNKVLEAMSMGRAVLVSEYATEGILADAETLEPALWRVERPEQFAAALEVVCDEGAAHVDISLMSRRFVKHAFDWKTNLQPVESSLI